MAVPPELSIIVVSYNSRRTIADCLRSLEGQKGVERTETIVVDSSADGTGEIVEERFPDVRLHRFRERRYPGGARNMGISLARGKIIAFIDADCVADEGWVEQILRAHRSPALVVGGSIANANPTRLVGWAAYLCEFSRWMPRKGCCWMPEIPTANISYEKELFEKYGGLIDGTYSSDTEFHWRLARDGHRLLFLPTISVRHRSIDDFWSFLAHEYEHGQCFARVRVGGKNFSKLQRAAYVLATPLIPLKLLLRTGLLHMMNRVYLGRFLASLPLLFLGFVFWSLGECVGYVKGRCSDG